MEYPNISRLHQLIDDSPLNLDHRILYKDFCRDVITHLELTRSGVTAAHLLSCIPSVGESTTIPISCLSLLLSTYPGPWPVFDVIRCYSKLWQNLPEDIKAGRHSSIVDATLSQVKGTYKTLPELLAHDSERSAIIDANNHRSLTHKDLSKLLSSFRLPIPTREGIKPVVAIALQNGPYLALACLAVATYYIAAPINCTSGVDQFRTAVKHTGASAVLVCRSDIARLGLEAPWVSEGNTKVLIVEDVSDLTLKVLPLRGSKETFSSLLTSNGPDDTCFVLSTSGTSGTKKLVPLTLHSIVSGVAFVADTWGLTQDDNCLNMMPLNHVGGLVRNLFAPIFSGGSTICCSAFDPNLFWDVVEEQKPTWYYASPSMHSTILEEAPTRSKALERSCMRLICNAAGGLLPSLAVRLRDTFKCTILPSYGMTECMPISSPPLNHILDRPGTSGISAGPEIAILGPSGDRLSAQAVGRIGVRGAPTFSGYLTADGIDKSTFTRDGWFDTGDLGFLDEDGYLFVTGRSKEVINRGGELISPSEIEEAIMAAAQEPGSPIYNRVSEALAFSIPHGVLQEAVGLVIVTACDMPRVDLRQIQHAVKSSLDSTKWPMVIVYMEGTPRRNNKVLRINLGDRLGFEPISETMTLAERHFEALCPPDDSPLSLKIKKEPCTISCAPLISAIEAWSLDVFEVYVNRGHFDGFLEVVLSRKSPNIGQEPSVELLWKEMRASLHGYLVPSKITRINVPIPATSHGAIDEVKLQKLTAAEEGFLGDVAVTYTEGKLREFFSHLLAYSITDFSSYSDFFEMGGDSLKAGKLLSMIRKEFQVRIPVRELFTNSDIHSLCSIIDECEARMKPGLPDQRETPTPAQEKTYSSTNPILLLLQLLPIGVLYPMRQAFQWTLFLHFLGSLSRLGPLYSNLPGRFLALLISVTTAGLATRVVAPLVAIIAKWLVIGRYKEGLYPMWSPYHTRWWFIQKFLLVGDKGVFDYFNFSRVLYYRMLGAKIGQRVSIDRESVLGEYDLLEIGDNVQLDRCICRPFGVEHNTAMYLGSIKLGRNASIGLKAVVAPGTNLPDDACIGPNSSTWETEDAAESNRDLSRNKIPQPHLLLQLLVATPIQIAVWSLARIPWMASLVLLVLQEPNLRADMVRSIILWFTSPTRIKYHFMALIANGLFGPVVFFLFVVAIKRLVDRIYGNLKPSLAANRSHFERFRMYMLEVLLPNGDLHKLTTFFGNHYEFTSVLVRALGGKVGSRVYWPNNGPSIQDFDLLDVGNDVVFGSRSHIVTSDGSGSQMVRIGNGAMVADRVVILPGASLGEETVLGSGALARRDTFYPSHTVWIGSQHGEPFRLSKPNQSIYTSNQATVINPIVNLNDKIESTADIKEGLLSIKKQSTVTEREPGSASYLDTQRKVGLGEKSANTFIDHSKPFGRAFYDGKAPYHLFGMFTIFAYSTFITIFALVYWRIAFVAGVQVVGKAFQNRQLGNFWWRPLAIYGVLAGVGSCLAITQSIIALVIVIASKWVLIGHRAPGNYDWDKSSYCQQWQVLLTIEKIRSECFGNHGIIGMLSGTHYAVLYFRALGAKIGKDCALFAGGRQDLLFTEPDLLTLGDRVAIDNASLVAHINSRGNFSLNTLTVGDRSVLRSGSRLLSGAQMGKDACLLEHTLIMAGDVADDYMTYQGWPADVFDGQRVKSFN